MRASLDEMYEEMLRGECSSRGKHAAAEAAPASAECVPVHGVHAAPASAADAPIHDEFELQASPMAAEGVPDGVAEGEGPRGFARYRNAAMVGAGGLACAAVGAFLGGIGGSFTIAPAAAHPLASSLPDGTPAANATNGGAATGSSTEAVVAAALTSLSGSLTQNAAPLQWLTAQSPSLPGTAAGIPSLGLPAIPGVPGLGGLGGLGALGSSLPGSSGASSLLSDPGGIGVLLGGVTGAVTGSTGSGSTSPSLAPLPLGGSGGAVPGLPGLPGLPLAASAGGGASTPTGGATGGASTGGTTSASSGSTTTPTTTTVTVPLPSLPVPFSAPPVTIGGISVGVSGGGSGSGLTLSLP